MDLPVYILSVAGAVKQLDEEQTVPRGDDFQKEVLAWLR